VNTRESQPLISIIVPVFNGEAYIADALQSIFEQTYTRFEVLVVDDGSTDNSKNIANSFDIKYSYQKNQGVAVARNQGIAGAIGEYITFLDQDDTWLPDKLQKQVDLMLSNADLGYVLTHQMLHLVEGAEEGPAWLREKQLNTALIGYLPSALMVRRSVFSKIGIFDPNYKTGSDGEWFFRAKDNHIRMEILQDVLVHRKIHRFNHSNAVGDTHKEMLKIIAG